MSQPVLIDSSNFVRIPDPSLVWNDANIIDARDSFSKENEYLLPTASHDSVAQLFEKVADGLKETQSRVKIFRAYNHLIRRKVAKDIIIEKFEKQSLKFGEYFTQPKLREISICFYANLDSLIELDFRKMKVSLTESPSLFFQLSDRNKYF